MKNQYNSAYHNPSIVPSEAHSHSPSPSVRGCVPHELGRLFADVFGSFPSSGIRLLGAGSDREYWRLTDDSQSAIGVRADSLEEARAFVSLAKVFNNKGVSVPLVFAHSEDYRYYLQQDLGSADLFSMIADSRKYCDGRISEEVQALLFKCMRSLARMQTVPEGEWSESVAFPPFSERLVSWDLNYFKYEYLKPNGIQFSEDLLEDDFERIVSALISIPEECQGFMLRDCQSRNVMVKDGLPYWIDFQGGRRGPALYDAVSFVYQAKADFSASLRDELVNVYAEEFCRLKGITKEKFLSDLPLLRLFRALQVLGAYGFRGLVQHRAHFIESIPLALSNLRSLLEEGVLEQYPELSHIVSLLIEDNRFLMKKDCLHVAVFSFSYKKGYPDDFSGNGGGFMFDCRALHNPGRYDEYKSLTGLDLPVVEFLEERGEVAPFLRAAEALVIPAVERYQKRGFTSLQIGFGCTGGQHRSVYCAHKLAAVIAERFPDVKVTEVHRERGISREFPIKYGTASENQDIDCSSEEQRKEEK